MKHVFYLPCVKTFLLCHKTVSCSSPFFRDSRALPYARLTLYGKWLFCTSVLNVEDEFAPLAARVSGQRILFRSKCCPDRIRVMPYVAHLPKYK